MPEDTELLSKRSDDGGAATGGTAAAGGTAAIGAAALGAAPVDAAPVDAAAVDAAAAVAPLARLHADASGLAALLAEAQQTWVSRARGPEAATPGWRPFEDAFPTFYQFTNRPR